MTVTPDELGATTRYLPLTADRSDYFNDQTPRWAASSNQTTAIDHGPLDISANESRYTSVRAEDAVEVWIKAATH